MSDFIRIKPDIPRTPAGIASETIVERMLKRPLPVPAFMLFAACSLTYLSENLIPMFVLSVFLAALCVYSCRKSEYLLFYCSLISIVLIISCCIRITSVLGVPLNESEGGYYNGTVISCERKLSGSDRINVVIQGIKAELRFGKDVEVPQTFTGDVFVVSGKFKVPESPGNPGEFDYPAYLKSKGIRYLFYADTYSLVSKASGIKKTLLSFPNLCYRVREKLFERFTYGRDSEDKALLAAVCLGDSSLAQAGMIRDFSLSGCSHLLAVSGTHFAGFLAVLPFFLNVLVPDRRRSSVIYVFLSLMIACVTGWSESVTRAAFMSSTAFAGKDTVSAMSAAALIMMAADPFCAARTGFLFSFSACIAIRLLSGRISGKLAFLKVRKSILTALSAQAAAWLGTMPFSTLVNSRYGIVQFIVQAFGGIIAKCVCMMFIPGVVLTTVFPKAFSYAFSAPSCLFLRLLRKTVGTGGGIVLDTSSGRPLSTVLILSFWMFLVLLLLPPFSVRKLLLKVSCAFLAVSTGFLVSGFVRHVKAEVIFADVGQGDCCLIMAGSTTCLIDSGTYEKGEKNVSDLLDYYGISRVDIAFMTHWDQDHAGGIAALDQTGRIGCIYTGFVGSDSDTKAFDKSLLSRKADPKAFRRNLKQTKAGDVFELSEDVRLMVIYPEKCETGGNPGSLVILLDCCGKTMLFTGDIDAETEEILVSSDLVRDVDLLKVSHHGSRYSSCSSFLGSSKPEIAVIQVGKNNLYGHPSPKTLERLAKTGSEVYRTDIDGAVILEFY